MFTILAFSSIALAWQDWTSRQVNVVLAVFTLIILTIGIQYFHQAILIFAVLLIYQHFRKNSIQVVDIIVFSLGAGYFSIIFLPTYCMITSLVLVVFSAFTKNQKLPFIVAWVIGFWGTFLMEFLANLFF